MNKKRLALAGIVAISFLAIVLAVDDYKSSQLSVAPPEIMNLNPVDIIKDANWTVEWYLVEKGINKTTFIASVQNQRASNENFNLSILLQSLIRSSKENIDFDVFEWKNVSITKQTLKISICYEFPIDNATGKNTTISFDCSIDNGTISSSILDWKKAKDLIALSSKAAEIKRESYGNILIDKSGSKVKDDTENGTKFFKVVISHPFFSIGEFAFSDEITGGIYHPTWNASVNNKYNHSGNYSNNNTKDMPILLNSSWCWGDGTVTNCVWGKADSNHTFIYFNNASDFYFVNGSENTQLPMQTEGKAPTSPYNFDPASVWDNFTIVILPNESLASSRTNITSLGQIPRIINYSQADDDTQSTTKIGAGYWRNAISTVALTSEHLTPAQPWTDYYAARWTGEWIFKPNAINADNYFIAWGDSAGFRIGFGSATTFIIVNPEGNPKCTFTISGGVITAGAWHYMAISSNGSDTTDPNRRTQIFIGDATGKRTWFNCSANISFFPLASHAGGIAILGSSQGLSSINGNSSFFMSNMTRSMGWVESRYENIILNVSNMSGAIAGNTNPTNNISAITPSIAYKNSTLNCSGGYTDADGNKGNVTFRFYNNSGGAGAANQTITILNVASGSAISKTLIPPNHSRGQTWNCTINATDSQAGAGSPVSATRAISNYPAWQDVPTILPATATTSSTLNCSTTPYDVDLDSLTLNFSWYNGSNYYNSSTFSASNGTMSSFNLNADVAKSETWNCTVFLNDGSLNSNQTSNTKTISDTSPYTASLTSPANNSNSSSRNVSFSYNSTDDDGDAITYYLYIDDVLNTTTTSNLTSVNISDGLHNWTVKAGTTGANASNASVRAFTIDATSPYLYDHIRSPATGVIWSNGTFYNFSIDVNDTTLGLDTVILQFDGLGHFSSRNQSQITNNGSRFLWNYTGINSGSYTYRWIANDTLGNSKESGNFTYDIVVIISSEGASVPASETLLTEQQKEQQQKYSILGIARFMQLLQEKPLTFLVVLMILITAIEIRKANIRRKE